MLYKTKEHKNREKKLSPVKDPSHLFYSSKVLPVECFVMQTALVYPLRTLKLWKSTQETPNLDTKLLISQRKQVSRLPKYTKYSQFFWWSLKVLLLICISPFFLYHAELKTPFYYYIIVLIYNTMGTMQLGNWVKCFLFQFCLELVAMLS